MKNISGSIKIIKMQLKKKKKLSLIISEIVMERKRKVFVVNDSVCNLIIMLNCLEESTNIERYHFFYAKLDSFIHSKSKEFEFEVQIEFKFDP